MLERGAQLESLASLGDGRLVHGFTTRLGGVSEGSRATLNVSAKRGDAPERVAENLRRIAAEGGFEGVPMYRVLQVHGRTVLHASELESGSEADALWWDRSGGPGVVSVTTADCVPILIYDAWRQRVAAIHSGWRGTVANIVEATVEAMVEGEDDRGSLHAAIGPCIERDAFEVGEEVAREFAGAYVVRAGYAKPHVDLVACIREQLVAAGVPPAQVERVGGCTHAHPERYFSYRRDGAETGQALSFIGFVA